MCIAKPLKRLQAGILSIRMCIRAHRKASKTSAGRRSKHMDVNLPKWGYEVGLTPKRLPAEWFGQLGTKKIQPESWAPR